MVILSRDVAMLFQQLQFIMLRLHQYRMCIIYKSGPDLHIADQLSCNNHTENKDQKISGLSINVNAISTPSEHASEYIHRRYTGSNMRGCIPEEAEGIHNTELAL